VPGQNTAWFIYFFFLKSEILPSHCSQLAVGPTFCVALLLSARVCSLTQDKQTRAHSVSPWLTKCFDTSKPSTLYHATQIQTEICGSLVIMLIREVSFCYVLVM